MKSLYIGLGALLLSCSSVSAQWVQEKNSYPGGIDDAAISFTIGDTIYVGGGSNGSKAFYKFDPSTGDWTAKASLPHPNAFGVGFAIGSKGYMALGQSDPLGSGQAGVSNDLWQYDPAKDEWTRKANFPGDARDAGFAFTLGNQGFVGGGTNAAGLAYNDFYSYDPAANAWDTLGPLPDNLYFTASFAIGNYGYITTGVGTAGETSSAWVYDPTNDSWNPITNFPGSAREAAVGFTLDGVGYVGMGHTNYTSVFTDFYSYLPSKNLWLPASSFPATQGRAWAVAAATSGTALMGMGSYFQKDKLIANSDFWELGSTDGVAQSAPTNAVHVFPNPAANYIAVIVPQPATEGTVSIKNSLGSECMKSNVRSGEELNIAALPAGMYEMEVTAGDFHSSEHFIKD